MIEAHSIGHLLIETGRITKKDYADAVAASKKTGTPPHEWLIGKGRVSINELVQAITILLDITLLKEALGLDTTRYDAGSPERPLSSYLERISLLFKTGMLLCTQRSVGSLVDLLVREAPSVMNAERATIFLVDREQKQLYSHMGSGLKYDEIRIPWDSGIAGWVFTEGKSLNIVDAYNDPRFNRNVDPRTGFTTKNLLCVPLRSPGGPLLGVFQVLNKRAGVFTSTDQEILEILASQAASSLESFMEAEDAREATGKRLRRNPNPQEAPGMEDLMAELVGTSETMQEIRSLIRKVAPTETTVLIQGESGTGKELVARAVHRLSRRANGPMTILNCAAIPSELIESELFGHKRGSFTGAIRDHEGVFRSAHGGTLFLDEIEATSPAMQVKLLRAIQTGEIRPVGDNASKQVHVRLVAATNQDLVKQINKGRFREDLYYRINVFPIIIPPLRERIEDIPILVRHFIDIVSQRSGRMIRGIDHAALKLLSGYTWPGNIRELENEIERAHVLTPENSYISVRSLSRSIAASVETSSKSNPEKNPRKLREAVDGLEKQMIAEALLACGGNRSIAAKRLGLSRQGLLNKLYKFGLTNQQ